MTQWARQLGFPANCRTPVNGCSRRRVLANTSWSSGCFLIILLLACRSARGVGAVDPDTYAQEIKDNAVGGTVLDKVIGNVTPLFTGYSAINPNVPTPVSVRCGEGPQPVNFSASASPSAQQYLYDLKRIVGDSYQTINGTQPKGTYNQSFGPGMYWTGNCIINGNGHPSCNFTFDAQSRALGLSQTRRVPVGGTVAFVSCGVYMDEGVVTSPTCFEDDSTTVAMLTVPFAERSVSKISFISTYSDSSPEGPPGNYSLIYHCDFAWNSFVAFDPPDQIVGIDPRITAFIPTVENGPFGPLGNGGNSAGALGRRLLRAVGRRLLGGPLSAGGTTRVLLAT